MAKQLEWIASRDGFTTTRCGRFDIEPDDVTKNRFLLRDNRLVIARADTQGQLKKVADRVAARLRSVADKADKPKTQKELVFDWLMKHGKLTRWTAFRELGVAELSSRIGEIEKDGWLVPRSTIEVTARNKNTVKVMEYHRPIKADAPTARPDDRHGVFDPRPGHD